MRRRLPSGTRRRKLARLIDFYLMLAFALFAFAATMGSLFVIAS